MSMKYKFNSSRFSQLRDERNLSIYRIKKDIHRTNPEGIQRWLEGAELRGEDIVDVCNAYGIPPTDFFLCDGQPMSIENNSESETQEESKILKVQLQMVTTERAEIEKQHLQAIADLEKAHLREKSEMEKDHLRELMQKEIDLAKREADIRNTIRRELQSEYEEQINYLRSQLLDLTTKYHKLDLKK